MNNLHEAKSSNGFLIDLVAMILISILTAAAYWYWHTCWQIVDNFCPSEQTSSAIFKYAAASTQCISACLAFLALNQHLKSLRNTSLLRLMSANLAKIFTGLNAIKASRGSGISTTETISGGVGFSGKMRVETLEGRILALEQDMLEAHKQLQSIEASFRDNKYEVSQRFNDLANKLRALRIETDNKIDGVAIGDLGFALWAIYLMMYSAIVGALA